VTARLPGRTEHPRHSLWRWTVIIALLLYLLAAAFQLKLPGINYDEVLDAVPAVQFLQGQPIDAAGSVHLFGRHWTLMTMPYIGATTSYIMAAGFAVMGVETVVLRLTTVCVGLLSLALIWSFLREFFDERVAALSVLLLALDPTYIFWSRMGAWVAHARPEDTILTLWSLFRWHRTGNQAFLVLAAFSLGFGLYTKMLFLWMWVALGIAWLLLNLGRRQAEDSPRGLRLPGRVTPRGLIAAGLALLIGISPLIVYNLQGGITLDFFRDAILSQETKRLVAPETLWSIPRVAMADLATLLNGSWFAPRYGTSAINILTVPALIASLLLIAGLSARHRLSYDLRRTALLAILLVSILLMSATTSISQGAEHLIILWPIPQALIAVAVFSLFDLAGQQRAPVRSIASTLIVVAAVTLVAAEGWTTVRHHRDLARTGGVGHFSDTISDLAADMMASPPDRLIALDWGFKRNLQFLSKGRLNPEEWFVYGPPGRQTETYLEQLVVQSGLLYLFHSPEYTAFGDHWELFERVAYRRGLSPVEWKRYAQRDGRPVYHVYSLAAAPPLEALPSTAHPRFASIGDGIRLLGYELPAVSSRIGTLQGTLYWQALEPQSRGSKVFAHLFDDSGRLWAQHDAVPRDWGHPTTEWQAGEIIADRIWLPLPAGLGPGVYHLFIGMVDEATGERLPIILDGQRLKGDTLGLADIILE